MNDYNIPKIVDKTKKKYAEIIKRCDNSCDMYYRILIWIDGMYFPHNFYRCEVFDNDLVEKITEATKYSRHKWNKIEIQIVKTFSCFEEASENILTIKNKNYV